MYHAQYKETTTKKENKVNTSLEGIETKWIQLYNLEGCGED